MYRCTRGCHSRFEGLKGRRRRRTRTGRHVRESSVARRNTAAAHRIAKKNAIFLPFSPLLGARNVCDARGITALINIGHDEYPTIDASLPPNRGSISIVHSLCVHSFDPRLRSTRKIFLPSSSVAVADSGLRGSARFDSGRERERANGKGKTGGGREKKKKKGNVYTQHSRLIFQQPLRCCTVSRYITRKMLRMIERMWNEDRRAILA